MSNIRTFEALAILLILVPCAFADFDAKLEAPRDDAAVRIALRNNHGLEPLRMQYAASIARFHNLTRKNVSRIFGEALAERPAFAVLPTFAQEFVSLSGLLYADKSKNMNHVDYYAVGALGYIQMFFGVTGERVEAAALYLKTDSKFVPLRSPEDIQRRLQWDRVHFEMLAKWIAQHTKNTAMQGLIPAEAAQPDFDALAAKLRVDRKLVQEQYEQLLAGDLAGQDESIKFFKSHGAIDILAIAFPKLKNPARMAVAYILMRCEGSDLEVMKALLAYLKTKQRELAEASAQLSDERR